MDLRLTARHVDPDRYLASLFADVKSQPVLWALIILNSEIARTREMVTDTTLGLIRLQWWRERLNKITDGQKNSDHPVLDFLSQSHITFTADDFDNLIYAREFDVEDVLPSDQAGMSLYAAATNAPLLNLFANVLNAKENNLNDLATAYGLVGLVRAVPFHAAQRRCYLPQNDIQKYNIDLEKLYAGHAQENLNLLCSEIVDIAQQHIKNVQPKHPFFRALKAITILNAKQLKAAHNNPFSQKLLRPSALKELRVALAVLKA